VTTQHNGQVMNNYGPRTIQMVRGEGVYLYDDCGRDYLDFTAGIAVVSLGHAHPAITEVISRQAATLLHCSNLYGIPGQQALADKLADRSGGRLTRAFFCNSGAEANEAAIKLVRKYAAENGEPQRTRIVSLPGAFHGRTVGALSITPKAAYRAGFGQLLADCITPPTLADVCAAIDVNTAACFIEVIQGEGGVHPVDATRLQQIAKRCKSVGALLVVDEVQTGVARTGTFFGYEHAGIAPDVVTLAKGLGNGVPIGAVIATSAVAQALQPGTHGSTFGGNPLAMAVANVVVDIASDAQFLAHVSAMGDVLAALLGQYFDGVSGRGLMWGFDVTDAKSFVAKAQENGVLLTAVGPDRVRVVPPLILDVAHILEFEARLAPLLVHV